MLVLSQHIIVEHDGEFMKHRLIYECSTVGDSCYFILRENNKLELIDKETAIDAIYNFSVLEKKKNE